MWANALKSAGLAPVESYIQPRLSIGSRVLNNEFSTGHFKIRVDSQDLTLTIKNNQGRIIWQSIHNEPFLSSAVGIDDFGTSTMVNADKKETTMMTATIIHPVVGRDYLTTRLQTITKIAYDEKDKKAVNIFGGLGSKLVLPTHMDYKASFKEISPQQLELSVKIIECDPSMKQYQRLILTCRSRKEESFYGFDKHPSDDHKGQKMPITIREQGKGRIASSVTTLWSSAFNLLSGEGLSSSCLVPFYMTSDNRGFYLTDSEYSNLDLKNPDRIVVRVYATTLTARLIDGSSLLDILKEYATYSGCAQSLSGWMEQATMAEIQGGREKEHYTKQQLHQH